MRNNFYPILQYCSTVWALHTLQDCLNLESVQQLIARFTFNEYLYTANVKACLKIFTMVDWNYDAFTLS